MAQSLIACPLCSAASFSNTNTLCLSLVNVASKLLRCTLCEEELRGLDKFTVHLLSHLIHTSDFKTFLNNSNKSPDTRAILNSQPLDLVKSQNGQKRQDLVQKPFNEGLGPITVQNEIRSERPSLKIDDEVMIFFNCDNSNECLETKNSEMNIVRALDRETPSSSGLPKFTINFDKTTSNQSENNTDGEKKNIISSENCFQEGSKNETLQYLFPITNLNDGSINKNISIPGEENKLQMEFSNNYKDKETHTSLPDMASISGVRNDSKITTMSVYNSPENHSGSKSSYLSPKGERVLGFRCDICSLVFPDEYIMSMHRQLIHIELHDNPSEPSSYKCHLCSKSFVMKGSLMVHMRVAHFGGAVVARLVEAKQLETNAVSPDSAKFICSICNKGFQKEQLLAQHEKLHDGKQCDVCFKTFTTKYFLRKHKRLHTGEMPYQCSQCNKSFTFQQSYHKHLLYHSDEKPYSCGDCGRAFKELSTLHNHQRIHTGEKPFSCETCGKCFRQRVSYLVHRRIHTGVMPYRCKDCGKTFRYKVSERTHKCFTSTQVGSSEAPNPPLTETKTEVTSTLMSNEKEVQRSNEDGMMKQTPPLEATGEPMHEIYPGPTEDGMMVKKTPPLEAGRQPMHEIYSGPTEDGMMVNKTPPLEAGGEPMHEIYPGPTEDGMMVKKTPPLEAGGELMHEIYPGPADFLSLVMSPSDRLQHLSLTSDTVEDSRSPGQHERIDSEALKQLLYDVADYT